MTTPAGMTDIFPAFSLGAVALLNLMARLDPPPLVRGGVVGALMLVLTLYLFGQLHLYLPDHVGLPAYVALTMLSAGVIWWNYRQRASKRT
jgi:hypothetical protein